MKRRKFIRTTALGVIGSIALADPVAADSEDSWSQYDTYESASGNDVHLGTGLELVDSWWDKGEGKYAYKFRLSNDGVVVTQNDNIPSGSIDTGIAIEKPPGYDKSGDNVWELDDLYPDELSFTPEPNNVGSTGQLEFMLDAATASMSVAALAARGGTALALTAGSLLGSLVTVDSGPNDDNDYWGYFHNVGDSKSQKQGGCHANFIIEADSSSIPHTVEMGGEWAAAENYWQVSLDSGSVSVSEV